MAVISVALRAMVETVIAGERAAAETWGSRPLRRDHEHLAVIDLIFRKDIRTGFRIYLNFRVGEARLDRSDGLVFVGNGDKE